ncbi:MAG: hypothetical protein HFG65_14260 [Hungatella sp.]|nr:hypothetical protein [Hungatella sp.]
MAKQEIYKFVVGIYEKIGYTRKASKKEKSNRLPARKKAICADLVEAGRKEGKRIG